MRYLKLRMLLKPAHAAASPRERVLALELRRVVTRITAGAALSGQGLQPPRQSGGETGKD